MTCRSFAASPIMSYRWVCLVLATWLCAGWRWPYCCRARARTTAWTRPKPNHSTTPAGLTPIEPGQEPPLRTPLPQVDSVALNLASESELVVFEIVGDGLVGWSARFVASPRLQQTDEPVDVAGRCVLQVDLTGVERAEGSSEMGPERLSPDGATAVVEVLRYPVEETVVQAFVGIPSPSPSVFVQTRSHPDRTDIEFAISD